MIDPRTMIYLSFITHLPIFTNLCPTFSLSKPRSTFSTLETGFKTLVCSLPGAGLAEMDSFLLFTTTALFASGFVVSGQTWSVWRSQGPDAHGLVLWLQFEDSVESRGARSDQGSKSTTENGRNYWREACSSPRWLGWRQRLVFRQERKACSRRHHALPSRELTPAGGAVSCPAWAVHPTSAP